MIKKVFYKCRDEVSALKLRLKATGKQKVFCIGRNKTGTTSVERAFKDLGFPEDRLLSIIDPTAVIPNEYCKIGSGSLICPLAQLSADTTLG